MSINKETEKVVKLVNDRLLKDGVLKRDDVSVNLGMDGSIIIYWARRPSKRQTERLKALIRESRKEVQAANPPTLPQSEGRLDRRDLKETS